MKRLIVSIVISVLLSALSIPAFAYKSTEKFMGISDDTAIVVVWKKESYNGKNKGFVACGPLQRCAILLKKTKKEAMKRTYDKDKEFARFVGNMGKYEIYSLDRKLKSYDTDARRCMK